MVADRQRERSLSAAELLDAWDEGAARHPIERAITLLTATAPGGSRHTLEHLTIGDRDGRLLALCESTFGARIVGLVSCPGCGEAMEISFRASDVRVRAESVQSLWIDVGDTAVHFRLPNSHDLATVATFENVASVRRGLLQRCILTFGGGGGAQTVDDLGDDVVDAIAARMSEADPQANVELAVECPTCGHAWHATFDVASFLWMQVDAWARRTLHDVHTLARAYGWSEDAILSMSATRRQAYLDTVSE
jgi:uncharacterized protein (UPF0212 family)